jgi:hypothetical protein
MEAGLRPGKYGASFAWRWGSMSLLAHLAEWKGPALDDRLLTFAYVQE